MASLDMLGSFVLNDEEVNKRVAENKIGNYAYGYVKEDNKKRIFIVRYVGRSDTDLRQEIKQRYKSDNKFARNECTHFKFSYADSVEGAYKKECKNFHDFGETESLLNEIHPAKPKGIKEYTCPVVGCDK